MDCVVLKQLFQERTGVEADWPEPTRRHLFLRQGQGQRILGTTPICANEVGSAQGMCNGYYNIQQGQCSNNPSLTPCQAIATKFLQLTGYRLPGSYSESPSEVPTQGPTVGPTQIPSEGPTVGPTQSPSVGPSQSPRPSEAPTQSPTVGPTQSPSVGPSQSPRPSEVPTQSPTVGPTQSPTYSEPSSTPSRSPSEGSITGDCYTIDSWNGANSLTELMNFCNAFPNVSDRCCQGSFPCWFVDGQDVTVCKGSCNSDFTCFGIASSTLNSKVEIGMHSCSGTSSCSSVGQLAAAEVIIGSDSCNGDFACNVVGRYFGTDVNIEDNACNGEYACFAAGLYDLFVTIEGPDTCNGDDACGSLLPDGSNFSFCGCNPSTVTNPTNGIVIPADTESCTSASGLVGASESYCAAS